MKILFITHYPEMGGANIAMFSLIRGLMERGHTAGIVFPKDGPATAKAESLGIKTRIIRNIQWAGPMERDLRFWLRLIRISLVNLKALGELKSYIREEGYDLIHTNTSLPYIGAIAARQLGIPHVWHIRELLHNYGFDYMFGKKYARRIYGYSDAIITISERVRREFVSAAGSHRGLRVVYDGTEDIPLPEREYRPGGRLRVLYAGGYAVSKGVWDMMKAALILRERGYSDRITISANLNEKILPGDIKEFYFGNSLDGVIDRVERYGDMREERMIRDMALMSSTDEAFGLVTIEAMRDGLLVTGADTGATPEIIEDGVTGLLYGQGDPESLADRLIWAYEHPSECVAIIRNGRRAFEERFTEDVNCGNICEVYEDVLKYRSRT